MNECFGTSHYQLSFISISIIVQVLRYICGQERGGTQRPEQVVDSTCGTEKVLFRGQKSWERKAFEAKCTEAGNSLALLMNCR